MALALAAALVCSIAGFSSLLRSQQRAHARREDLLLNQLLHAVGKPWQPSPAAEDRLVEPDPVPVAERWTAAPEQLPTV